MSREFWGIIHVDFLSLMRSLSNFMVFGTEKGAA